jgi:GTP-binding nuclear protein Ran
VACPKARRVSHDRRSLKDLTNLVSLPTSNHTLDFVAAPALEPAEVAVDAALMAQYALELKQVRHLLMVSSPQVPSDMLP